MKDKKTYKDTLNLPKTQFPMKGNLTQKEPIILKKWQELNIYEQILTKNKNNKQFILHDGPPYANGHLHLGHVLNKTLKDVCIKFFSMNGYFAPYVPGWDCHGLPVEHQLLKEMKITKHDIDQVEFRKKAYNYAMKFVKIQAKEFKRLGVFADWDNPYLTLNKEYEADILFSLAQLYEKGYIYKDLKPVNWCKTCETALAEAEVEYEEKISPSIYVKFKTDKKIDSKEVSFVIWTTTPWTLIANVAVALHPDFLYSFVLYNGEILILASDLVDNFMNKIKSKDYKEIKQDIGKNILKEFDNCCHPFIDRESKIVLADYVTKEDGTGCVHTAPGHGQDDYLTGKKNNLPIIMPVDDSGKFVREAGEFFGKDVLEANDLIIEKLKQVKALYVSDKITHSYPHCWRCKKPIIFRATEQWFMNVDYNNLREKIKNTIQNDVKWIPNMGKDRIYAMINSRPDWCISRQRYWGVPIPAFKCKDCGEGFTSVEIIKKIACDTKEKGSNIWFEKDVKDLLINDIICNKCGGKEFVKENNILDVWFDSGISHVAVLKNNDSLKVPADLYLEGSDQHRGWFQSSLITSMGMNDSAPYKQVLTHGFVVDKDGRKMSKSIGNVISVEDIVKKYGVDILRLWVCSSDYEVDIKISDEILDRLVDGYRKIRNTFRFLLSNIYDFDYSKDSIVNNNELFEIDRWMISKLNTLLENVNTHYNNWDFHKVYRKIYDFCVYEISSFYLDILKDTLYTLDSNSLQRRSTQTVIFKILYVLVRLLAPIIPFTTEEIWQYINLKNKKESIFLENWPNVNNMGLKKDEDLNKKWEKILRLRDYVMKVLERKREKGDIGSSLEAKINIAFDEKPIDFIVNNIDIFPMIFKVSQIEILDKVDSSMEKEEEFSIYISVEKAKGKKCQRCWNFSETVSNNHDEEQLCERCSKVINNMNNNFLTEKQLEKIKENLIESKKQLLEDALNLEKESLHTIMKEDLLDMLDTATDSYNKEISLELVEEDRQRLIEIDKAIDRINKGIYGKCGNCGQYISKSRLEAIPSVRFCIKCQEQEEKSEKK